MNPTNDDNKDDRKEAPKRAPQRRVGSFVLLEKLGAGGIGEVWKARDYRLNRVVALKFILEDAMQAPQNSKDLLREARAVSALNHPNIVTILEIGESDGSTYIAMEFVEGETLRNRIDKIGASFETALDIASQMAKGLAAAHDNGIVHRDIKPENVMIRVDGYVKLVDFGFAKVLPWAGDSVSADPTQSGQITGTFKYMSPEQARGQKVEPSSDIFSFGIVLYELLTGEHPFRADTPIDTLHRIIKDEPVSTRVRCPDLPEQMHEIVEKCLKKDKTQRYQSASDLEAHLRGSHTAQPKEQRRLAIRKSWIAAILLAALLAILIVLWNPLSKPARIGAPVHSVAVMNLTTPAGDPIAGVIAQGLSEELGGALAREGFLVPARSRILALTATDAQKVGAELNVDAVLEGNVTKVNDAYKVYIELVDSRTGFQIWSRLSTTSQADVLSSDSNTSDEIAREVRSAVGGK